MVWQAVGAIAGGLLANKAAKEQSRAMDRANAMSNMGYTDARPYITDMMSRGKGALNDILATGAYQGPTYASMNPMETAGYNTLYNTGTTGAADASTFMNQGRGFGQNYQNLYNQASQDMLGNAINYATANTDPLLRSAMRDDYRNLMENQLPGTGLSASNTGNTNSSRRGVAEAVLERGYQDRQADTAASIQDNLMSRSLTAQQNQLNNMTTANQNLAGLYGLGFDQAGAAGGRMTAAGSGFRTDEQNRMNDERDRFERMRDFEMDQLNAYNAGILGQAPRTPSGYTPNLVNPTMAGLSGAMQGFGFGGKIANYFSRPSTMTQAAPVYGGNSGSMGMGFGNNPYGF